MSVSKVKKQFEDFATYLGRDVIGLERLKKLKDAVNELRTRLAAAEEKATKEVERAELEMKRARAAELELSELTLELQRLQQIVANLTHNLQAATVMTEPAQDEIDNRATPNDEQEIIKRVLKRLRTRLKYCPRITRFSKEYSQFSDDGKIGVWDREEIATGWSQEALWTLGASVAVLVAYGGAAVIESRRLLRNLNMKGVVLEESAARPLIDWLRKKNIDMNSTEVKSGPLRVVNLREDNIPTTLGQNFPWYER